MRWVVAALAAAVLASPAAAQDGPGERIATEFARPALTALIETSKRAEAEIGALCAAPSEAALARARAAFAGIVADWGRVTVLRFGPLADDNRFERIFFWPDRRGIALRQVQGLLAKRDEGAATAAGLSERSVALQGIPALEFVLFGTGAAEVSENADSYRCRFGQAIAGNIGALAGEVLDGWRDDASFARSFMEPAANRDPYRTADEVNGEVVKALSTAFQYVRAAEILPALGESADDARGKRAPLWRSGLTFALIAGQVKGARDLLGHAGYRDALPDDRAWVADSINFELETALGALEGIETPPDEAFGAEDARGKIGVANLALDHAGHLVSEQLAAALGLIMGFNALDGD